MKQQKIPVKCVFAQEGNLQDILQETFCLYIKRVLAENPR